MKKYYTQLRPIGRLTVVVLLLLSCAPGFAVVDGKECHDTVTLCANNAFPPYEYVDNEGNYCGFDVDILKAVMDKLQQPYKITMCRWDVAQTLYKLGKVDVLIGVFRHEGLTREYNFGLAYASLFHAAIYRRGSCSYNSIESLKGKRVLLEMGDGMEPLMRKAGLSKEIVHVKNMIVGLQMLSRGQGDVAIGATEMARYVIDEYELRNLDMNGIELLPEEFCFVCRDKHMLAAMDSALVELRRDGSYQRICNNWFNVNSQGQILRIVLLSIVALLVVSGIAFAFIYLLRRRIAVAKRKIELQYRQIELTGKKMQLAISSSNMAYWEIDTSDCSFTSYNETLFQKAGWCSGSIDCISSLVHPDDVKTLHELDVKIRSCVKESFSYDLRLWSSEDKAWHYNTVVITPFEFDADGKVTRYVGFRHDNTQVILLHNSLRDFSEKLDYVLESCGIKPWNYDIDSGKLAIFSRLNEPIESISFKEFMGRIDEDDRATLEKIYPKLIKGEMGPFNFQVRVRNFINRQKDRHIIYSGVPEYDVNHRVTAYFGLARDVTDFIELQDHLKEETRKAQVADRLKSAFLENVSHEIRTPLNAIVGFSQLLQETTDPDERKQFINIVNENTGNLVRIIGDVLELSKIETGAIEIRSTRFDLVESVHLLVSSVVKGKIHNGVKLIEDQPYSRCLVKIDGNRLAQLITNFLNNAIKYTIAGYIRVGYECSDGKLRIEVEDTGVGLAETDQSRIFERFVKVDDFVQGVGLGLSICKAITEAMGGQIGVTSAKGKGATFWAEIPCEVIESIPSNKV